MTFHVGYNICIKHPETDEEVDAIVSFDFYKGYPMSWDEPGYEPELELATCLVYEDGELIDILDRMTTCQIHQIENELMESNFNDPYCAEPDDYDYLAE